MIFSVSRYSSIGPFVSVRKPLFFPLSNLDSRRTNRGFVAKSKRLRDEKKGVTTEIDVTDEQIKQMKNELSIENYVESFIRTLFPELNGENGYWIIQQLTNDVVNEMNQLKKSEVESITNDILPLFQDTA